MTLPTLAHAKEAHVAGLSGWATDAGAVLFGRAVKGAPPSGRKHHSKVGKLASTAKAFSRRDLEHARVVVTDVTDAQAARTWSFQADDEGFFDVRVPGPFVLGPRTLRVTVEGGKYRGHADVTLTVHPRESEGLIVVCDIDDTLVHTGVTDGKLDMVWDTATRDAGDMKPFPASPAVMGALAERGALLVYLTASPVELAPRLAAFLGGSGFPMGALLLRYWARDGVANPDAYKRKRVDRLLADFPRRRLLLFGDNGERDPELFSALARDTGRVELAYVRATLPVQAGDARYGGQVVFQEYREVARDLARRGLVRWWRGQRIYLEGGQ